MPVSYTHLEVYKRQSLGRGAKHAVHLESAEEGVVAGDAVELALNGAHGIACAAQRCV